MSYDHSKKIGNEGDLVKHVVLHNCVKHLAKKGTAFVYVDCHSGRPNYILSRGGEWKNGIRSLMHYTVPKYRISEYKGRSKYNGRSRFPEVGEYCKSHLPSRLGVGKSYFGSSNIVFRVLRESRMDDFQFHLFDTDVHAFDDLKRYYFPHRSNVTCYHASGYLGIQDILSQNLKPTLVLIDPPRLIQNKRTEAFEVENTIKLLKENSIDYICWTPRQCSRDDNDKYTKFGQRTDLGGVISVRWRDRHAGGKQKTFGCQLTVSNNLMNTAQRSAKNVVKIMNKRLLPKLNNETLMSRYRRSRLRFNKWKLA